MIAKFFDIGELVRVTAVFTDSAGTNVDPTTVSFQYRADAIGIATTYTYPTTIVKAATGVYYVSIDTNESAGEYSWRFYATGTGQSADTDRFYVRPSTTAIVSPAAASTVTFPLSVSNGGTGVNSLTGLVVGNGTSVFTAVTSISVSSVTGVLPIAQINIPVIVVASGGTGQTTLGLNGVLYGNAASAINIASQGSANSVLTANAGAPVFSTNPQVNSLTALSNVTVLSFKPAVVVLNSTSTQNYYLGIDDAKQNRGYIGDGFGPGQNITPTLSWEATTHRVMVNGTTADAGARQAYGTAAQIMYGQQNILSDSDIGLWLRRSGGADTALYLESFGQTGGANAGAILVGINHRGTSAVPTATQSGDHLLILDGRGDDGTVVLSTDTTAQVSMFATQAFSAGSHGSELRFYTTLNNTTAATLRATITHAGAFALTAASNQIVLQSAGNTGTITATPSTNKIWTLPDLTGTVALTANSLGVFAATTSAQLAGVISDETGSGLLVFGTAPTFTTSMALSSGSLDFTRPGGIQWNGTSSAVHASDGSEGAAGSVAIVAGGALRMVVDTSGNVAINTTTVGTNATSVLAIKSGSAPTTAPAGTIQIYSEGIASGSAVLSVFQPYAPFGISVGSATTNIPVQINGTTYYILAKTAA